jgi:pyruvate formate lyase activating enzyme
MTKEAIETIAPYLDAANIDLKSFRDEYYKKSAVHVLNQY